MADRVPANWRHVYKALLLLDYMIKNGSEQVIQEARTHIMHIQQLDNFQASEEGKDTGYSGEWLRSTNCCPDCADPLQCVSVRRSSPSSSTTLAVSETSARRPCRTNRSSLPQSLRTAPATAAAVAAAVAATSMVAMETMVGRSCWRHAGTKRSTDHCRPVLRQAGHAWLQRQPRWKLRRLTSAIASTRSLR